VGDEETDRRTLRNQFHLDLIRAADRLKKEVGYNPTRFLQMVGEYGAVETAKRLLERDEYSEGFATLWEKGRLELSVEAFVLRPEYEPLFTETERRTAQRRLREVGFDPTRRPGPAGRT
jgi:hypothetical protein